MFTGSNYIQIVKEVDEIYTDEFLKEICDRLKISNFKRKKFKKCVKDAAISYLNAVDMNSNRITPEKQSKLMNNYADAIEEVQKQYRNIQQYTTTSGKFGKSLRRLVSKTKEPGMKDMFYPYVDDGSMATTLFDKFLGVIVEAARQAPEENIGNDKKVIEGKLIAFWVASIRRGWDMCVSDEIPFQHGKTYKEMGGDTTNTCPRILCLLFEKISPNTPKTRVKTALRKVIKTDKNMSVANFITQ